MEDGGKKRQLEKTMLRTADPVDAIAHGGVSMRKHRFLNLTRHE